MMRFFNSHNEYGLLAKLFHWVTFIVLIAQVPFGFYLVGLEFSDERIELENIHISADDNQIDCPFPVQYVVRPQTEEFHDYRGYAGRIAGGIFKPGDDVCVLPSGFNSKIKSIDMLGGSLEEAFAPQSVCMCLEDEIDISRGDMIVKEGNMPEVGQDIDVMVCWLNQKPLIPQRWESD